MEYSKYRFNLDMQSYISQVSLPVRQHDTGIVLRINLTDGGVPYVIKDGCRAVFYARKTDGNPLMNDCVIEKNTTICYELTQQTTSCSGVVDCEVRLYGSDGNLITTPRFILVIDSRVVHDEDFPLSEAEQTVLDNIILSEQKRLQNEKEREETHDRMLDTVDKASEVATTLKQKLDTGDYNGITPHVGDNRNWWLGEVDTGVLAWGVTPHIGANGNWWFGEEDSGVLASGYTIPLRVGEGEYSIVQVSDLPNKATKKGARAFGRGTIASGEHATSEGLGTGKYEGVTYGPSEASGAAARVEGIGTKAPGEAAHAENFGTIAGAKATHAGGIGTVLSHKGSFGHGLFLRDSSMYQALFGKYNKENPNALFIVGNGTSDTARSNAFEVLKDGTAWFKNETLVATGDVEVILTERDNEYNNYNYSSDWFRDIEIPLSFRPTMVGIVSFLKDHNGNGDTIRSDTYSITYLYLGNNTSGSKVHDFVMANGLFKTRTAKEGSTYSSAQNFVNKERSYRYFAIGSPNSTESYNKFNFVDIDGYVHGPFDITSSNPEFRVATNASSRLLEYFLNDKRIYSIPYADPIWHFDNGFSTEENGDPIIFSRTNNGVGEFFEPVTIPLEKGKDYTFYRYKKVQDGYKE